MAIDSKFYQIYQPIASSDLPDITDVVAVRDLGTRITHACEPAEALPGAVLFIGDEAYLAQLAQADDITIITTAALAKSCPDGASIYTSNAPRIAFSQILAHLYQTVQTPYISSTADIAPDAQIGKSVSIGAFAKIEAGVVIGDNAIIGDYCHIGACCEIGEGTEVKSHSVITHAQIGNQAVIHAHCVIGKAGFGFEMTANGAVMVPHLGTVRVGNHVHIGAHSVIDKGVLGQTQIADDVMIDNHVHIAHNVTIGKKSIILAQVGIAGSAVIGKSVILAGQVGVKDHVTIADGAIILSAAKVTKDIEEAGTYGGYPAVPAKQHWREQAALRRLVATKKK